MWKYTGTSAARNPAVADSQQRRSRKLNTPTTNCNMMMMILRMMMMILRMMMNNDEDNDVNLNGIDSHGSEAEPGVDAVEMRDWVWLPVFVLPLLIMIMMIIMMMTTAQ